MKNLLVIIGLLVAGMSAQAQESVATPDLIDVVWLKDGSRLIGTITRWDLEQGLELRLASGALMDVPKKDINQVFQQVKRGSEDALVPIQQMKVDKPYAFKEHGLYQTVSMFFHVSDYGGLGINYSIGHRFNRLFSLGLGFGYESNEINSNRNLVPIYAEVRGFTAAKKLSPYYALKTGYSFAPKSDDVFEDGKGGMYISPEIGLRFRADKVNFYLGAEFKYQQASYTSTWSSDYQYTDKIGYKRLELRTGIIF